MLGYDMLQRLITALYRYSYRVLRNVGRNKLRQSLFEKLHEINIEELEDPELQNKLQRIDENIQLTTDFTEMAISMIGNIIGIISLIAIVFAFQPYMVPLLILVAGPLIWVNKHFIQKDWNIEFNATEARRKAGTSATYLTNTANLHEVNVIGAFKFLAGKYTEFYDWYNTQKLKLRARWLSSEYLLETIAQVGLLIGIAYTFIQFVLQKITIGTVTFQVNTLRSLQGSISELSYDYTNVQENSTRIYDFFEIMNRKYSSTDGTVEMPRLETGPSIEFKNLTFTYPRSEKPIYEDLNLSIKSGEKLAIVGHNGAGKTTLVRLISRLYKATSGDLLINGTSINDLKIDDWYKNIGILFQDYNTYGHLSAEENIYIGRTSKPIDEQKIIEAAESADADSFINEFPDKYEQILSERFKKGKRPSTGQWQKLAIARFFYRNAPLVIFDEPTASIDAVSEFKIFNRIYEFFKGKTVIIISHRFSTVRNADRIIVVDHGKIIEEGTHEQLIALNGKYAEAFKLQAEGYN